VSENTIKKVCDLMVEFREYEDKQGMKKVYKQFYVIVNGLKVQIKAEDRTGQEALNLAVGKEKV
jgi:hypothetical protein